MSLLWTPTVLSRDRLPVPRMSATPRRLTPREIEVVKVAATGAPDKDIAVVLGCSPYTVKNHVRSIYDKLGLESRTGLLLWWLREGIDLETDLEVNRG